MIKSKIKYINKKISINDFSTDKLYDDKVSDKPHCVSMYNISTYDGHVRGGMGIRDLMVHADNDLDSNYYALEYNSLKLDHINKVMYFKQYFANSGNTTHRLLIHGSDNKLYMYQMFYNLSTPNWVYELQFDNIPAVLEYKKDGLDSILISDNNKLLVWSTGRTPYEITNIQPITSMCVYNDELFCTIASETDKIWYTSNLDPESFVTPNQNAKYLIMEGSAGGGQKIVMLKENIYVFCDYGIGRINTYATVDHTYHQIYSTNSKIIPNSVTVCGDVVMFLTRDGLYRFNGANVRKIEQLNNLFKGCVNEYAVASSLNDNYYFATNIHFGDAYDMGCELDADHKNNALVKINLNDFSFEIMRGVDVKDMLSLKAGVEEKIVLTFNTVYQHKIGEICTNELCFGKNLFGGLCTNFISPEGNEQIILRKINIDSTKNVRVLITTENKSLSVTTNKDGFNQFQIVLPCTKFNIRVDADSEKIDIRSIELEYSKKLD